MAIFLTESFTGSGPVIGSAPQVNTVAPFAGSVWATGANASGITKTASGGTYTYSDPSWTGDCCISGDYASATTVVFAAEVDITLGPVGSSTYGRMAMTLEWYIGGSVYSIEVSSNSAGAWSLYTSSGAHSITVSAGQTYTLHIEAESGAQTYSFAGVTVNDSVVWPTPEIGIYSIDIGVGNASYLKDLRVANAAADLVAADPATGACALYSPVPFLSGYVKPGAVLTESFVGYGSMVGREPSTNMSDAFVGAVWSNSSISLNSGTTSFAYAQSTDQATPSGSGGIRVVGASSPGVGLTAFVLNLFVLTPTAIGSSTYGREAIAVYTAARGVNYACQVAANPSGVWALNVGTAEAPTTVSVPVTISAATEYQLTMEVDIYGELSVTFAGASASHLPVSPEATTGLDSIILSLGGVGAGMRGLSVYPPYTLQSAHAFVDLRAPMPTLSAFGGATALMSAPRPILTANAHNSYGEQAALLTAPSPALTIRTGANAKGLSAPSPTLVTSGTVTGQARAPLSAPSPTLNATGEVSGMARAILSAPSPNIVGYGGAVCSITLTNGPTLTSTGTTGGVGGAQVTCPLFQLSAGATAQNRGSANLLSPSPRLGAQAQARLTAPSARLTAIGTAVVTATYEAYAVNLKHTDPNANDEATRYTNFPFTHVVRYQNSYYGANSTGLYLLEGSTDDGTPIPWAVQTAMTDFKTPNKKTLAAAYFSGRLGPASTISLIEGEHTPSVYSFTTPRGTLAQNHRQKFGKGTKGRYYALSASGTGTCELDGIEPEVHQLTRRI